MGATCLISFFLVLVLLYILRVSFQRRKCYYSEKLLTIMLILLGSFGCTGWSLVVLLSTIDVNGPGIILEPSAYSDPFSGRYNVFALFFGPLAIGATVLGLLNVTLLLFSVANSTLNLQIANDYMLARNRILIHIFQLICIVLAIIAFTYEKGGPNGTSILGFLLGPPALIILVAYTWGAIKLTRVIRNSGLLTTFKPVMEGVRNTTIGVLLALILYLVSVVTYSSIDTLGGSWKNFTSQNGSFGVAKVFHHLQIMAVMIACGAIAKFLYDSLFDPKERSTISSVAKRISQNARSNIQKLRPSSLRTTTSTVGEAMS